MEIHHHFSFNANKNGSEVQFLVKNNFRFRFHTTGARPERQNAVGLVTLEMSEDHPSWSSFNELVAGLKSVDLVTTKFSNSELMEANLLAMSPQWHHGYPMPDLDNGYIESTYDTKNGCFVCGIGWEQNAPFRLKGEPSCGNRQIFQLNWVFDEYFVTPEAYHALFKPHGVSCRAVLHHRTGRPLRTVVQLVVDPIAKGCLAIERPPHEVCDVCGKVKHHAHTRGWFPKLLGSFGSNMFKTKEYFGSGGSAWRAVIVTNELYKAMKGANLKGVNFCPLATNT